MIFVRRPLQHGPADSPRSSICRVASDIDLTICLPFKSGSTPLIDGTQQHDSLPFRLTYIKDVSYGFLVWFRLRGLDLAARHELDPENLLTRSLKVKLFQIIT